MARRGNCSQPEVGFHGNLGDLALPSRLVDDALDYAGREAELGKTVGDDFREGKITLPVILAFLRGRTVEREFWKRTIEKLDQREGDLEQAKTLIDRHGASPTRWSAPATTAPWRAMRWACSPTSRSRPPCSRPSTSPSTARTERTESGGKTC